MIAPYVLFWILIIWGLYDGDLDLRDTLIFSGVWLLLLAGFFLLKIFSLWFVVPTVLLDIVLLLKVCGGDVPIR